MENKAQGAGAHGPWREAGWGGVSSPEPSQVASQRTLDLEEPQEARRDSEALAGRDWLSQRPRRGPGSGSAILLWDQRLSQVVPTPACDGPVLQGFTSSERSCHTLLKSMPCGRKHRDKGLWALGEGDLSQRAHWETSWRRGHLGRFWKDREVRTVQSGKREGERASFHKSVSDDIVVDAVRRAQEVPEHRAGPAGVGSGGGSPRSCHLVWELEGR